MEHYIASCNGTQECVRSVMDHTVTKRINTDNLSNKVVPPNPFVSTPPLSNILFILHPSTRSQTYRKQSWISATTIARVSASRTSLIAILHVPTSQLHNFPTSTQFQTPQPAIPLRFHPPRLARPGTRCSRRQLHIQTPPTTWTRQSGCR